MNQEDIMKLVSSPVGLAALAIFFHTRINRVEQRLEFLADHFNAPKPQAKKRGVVGLWLLIAVLIPLLFGGCTIPRTNIVAAKQTVFGLDISSDPQSQIPHVRLGLVRYYFQSIPTATNAVYAPPYSSTVDADIGIARQTVNESFSTKP